MIVEPTRPRKGAKMKNEIVLSDGVKMCIYCHSRQAEDEPMVHTQWCSALSLGLQSSVKRAQLAAVISVSCVVVTAIVFAVNHV